MSTARKPQPQAEPDVDLYPLGWRETGLSGPDGAPDSWRVPLNEHDILHPEVGDFIVQDGDHIEDCIYLKIVLDERLAGHPTSVVLTDVRVDLGLPGVKPVGPDLAAFAETDPAAWPQGDRGTLQMALGRNARPLLMIEITSPSTREKDFDEKWRWYAEAGVPLYVIADVKGRGPKRRVDLLGHQLVAAGDAYEPVSPDDQGRLWLGDELGVWLAVANRRLVCLDGQTGAPIGGYRQIVREGREAEQRARRADLLAAEAEARAEAEQIARVEAEGRIRALEAELRRLRGEP